MEIRENSSQGQLASDTFITENFTFNYQSFGQSHVYSISTAVQIVSLRLTGDKGHEEGQSLACFTVGELSLTVRTENNGQSEPQSRWMKSNAFILLRTSAQTSTVRKKRQGFIAEELHQTAYSKNTGTLLVSGLACVSSNLPPTIRAEPARPFLLKQMTPAAVPPAEKSFLSRRASRIPIQHRQTWASRSQTT